MNQGGEDLLRQFNKGIDYAQSTFNIAEGVTSFAPTLLFKGVVIDVNFETSKSTISAALLPPFSVYAKIIGLDDSSPEPLEENERTYYPPFFPMHNICIPEVGEEVLIFKETPEASAAGYYVGRVNDSTPLNISYARDYVGLNDPETKNSFRYGFNFDVRQLREKFSDESPSVETANISIPLTFGDVVQQGRSKTYVRQSFNRNNKKGVLEQGIRLDGQLAPGGAKNIFRYYGSNDGSYQRQAYPSLTETKLYRDEETGETMEVETINEKVYGISNDEMMKVNKDPSIGETSTKTIHFIDSSIKRLGNYSYQSVDAGKQVNDLEGEDKAMIVNIADEIYNISSREISGALYRQVLGEKLVLQQRQSYEMINQVLQMVGGFAESTQLLLDAFLEHEHALPRIDLNLEKEIVNKDLYRTPVRVIPQGNQMAWIRKPKWNKVPRPARVVTIPRHFDNYAPGGGAWIPATTKSVPTGYKWVRDPGLGVRVPRPPKIILGKYRVRNVRQKINFDAIIGGAENPRFTARIATVTDAAGSSQETPATPVGEKTGQVNKDLEDIRVSFFQQQEKLGRLSGQIAKVLSKNQFVN